MAAYFLPPIAMVRRNRLGEPVREETGTAMDDLPASELQYQGRPINDIAEAVSDAVEIEIGDEDGE